jgi:uncharacterized protein (DUF1778 family)
MSLLEQRRRFELRGTFSRFTRTDAGKRRMALRLTTGEEVLLKFPKELRQRYEPLLKAGVEVAVAGIEEHHLFSLETKRTVRFLQILSAIPASACAKCPIRICAKKSCWKNGGESLWRRLEQTIVSAGLEGAVQLKAVGCFGNCKRGPNLSCAGEQHERGDRLPLERVLAAATRMPRHR